MGGGGSVRRLNELPSPRSPLGVPYIKSEGEQLCSRSTTCWAGFILLTAVAGSGEGEGMEQRGAGESHRPRQNCGNVVHTGALVLQVINIYHGC